MKKKNKAFPIIIYTLLLFLAFLCFYSAKWYIEVYGDLGFDSIINTLLSGLQGVAGDLLTNYMANALLPTILSTCIIGFILFATLKKRLLLQILWREGKVKNVTLYPFSKWVSVCFAVCISFSLVFAASNESGLITYVSNILQRSTIFEDYYINPDDVNVLFPEQKRNLIYIYLESMETSFFSRELGGGNDVNVIPELYELALSNINFSQNSSVGGFSSLSGSGWTIGALVAQTAGIPLKTPINIDGNSYGQDQDFLPGVVTLTDILHDNGYYQAFMVGSDATFGGRKQYYEQHGVDVIYDLFTAREESIVNEDYYVWWGMEDYYLFEYAKEKISDISTQEEPFAFTMLTADTHHIDGYVCKYCNNEYEKQYENVLACSSKQVIQFVQWIQEQEFYQNTTVVICGDHPTMDAVFITENIDDNYDRRVYNCFINAPRTGNNTKNREFCSLDLFPTTLAAMGCRIEGDRLGLGTDLFSDTQTLCEVLGKNVFGSELSKYSLLYTNQFYYKN